MFNQKLTSLLATATTALLLTACASDDGGGDTSTTNDTLPTSTTNDDNSGTGMSTSTSTSTSADTTADTSASTTDADTTADTSAGGCTPDDDCQTDADCAGEGSCIGCICVGGTGGPGDPNYPEPPMCPAGTIDGSAAGINSCLPECGEGEGLMKECAQPDSGTAVGVCALGQTPMQDPTMCETDDDCTDMMFPTCGNFPMGMVCANFTHCILICNDGMNMFQCPPGMTCAASGACEY